MNPTAALMLSSEFEQDRRRAVAARRHRIAEPEPDAPRAAPQRTSVWTMLLNMPLHMPRFGPAR